LADSGLQQPGLGAYLHWAHTAFLAGETAAAGPDLEYALALAGKLGFDQSLVVDGQHLESLLRYAAAHGIGQDVLPGLLECIAVHRSGWGSCQQPGAAEPALITQP
jgi:hypothetical protein